MASFLRPDARDAIWRWREVLVGVAIAGIGLWWLATFYPPVRWVGWAILAIGVGGAIAGLQRARFRQPGIGPGVVQVVERRLAYFGPLTGGAMDVEDLTRLVLDPTGRPAHWRLTGVGGQEIEIPVNAKGVDALFDLFAALPGIDTTAMLDVLTRTPDARVTVWERQRPLLH